MRTVLAGTVAATGLTAGMLLATPATAAVAPMDSAPSAAQQQSLQPECLYKNNSGNRQPIKNRPRRRSNTVGHVGRGDARWGPCRSTTDGGRYKACGPGRSRVWTRIYSHDGWIKTRCFKRVR